MVRLSGRWGERMSKEVEWLMADSGSDVFAKRYRAFCEGQRRPVPDNLQMLSAKEELLDQLLESQEIIGGVESRYEKLERRASGDQASIGQPDVSLRIFPSYQLV